ncbi:MAG: bifunctional (p)ppGpp synthetase/guanosine-3',5'-bis(diphosphate) 3'-pyrophosphohydrolase [Bacilli bacterium]|nr:bifunctional (p)ppGpp synthetase/guanosine-3',5'-bis(diphosphate) 3'-pyrophosphohydrolase [Bacilli bacterium]
MIEALREELIKRVSEYLDNSKVEKIKRALDFSLKYKNTTVDYNGDEFLLHVLRTAIILTELHSDDTCISASLIGWLPVHIEEIEIADLASEFDEQIVETVSSLQKISKLKLKDEEEESAIYLRKVLVGLSSDARVIIIKLASRLDNLRKVYTKPSAFQKNKCIETKNVLIPIAHRLGINYIKSELEDLCLKYLKPEAYDEVLDNLNASYEELNSYIEEMKAELSDIMCEQNISFRIKGRVKSIHSLHAKLAKGKKWKDIYDVLALRIIVKKESECYLAIGLIHSKYRPIPKRFKDYIAKPKENMYQSLHTGVVGPNGKVFEIQIRTEEMDEIAECGIASHWSYKEHGSKAIQKLMEQKLEVFRDSIDDNSSDEELIKEFKENFIEKMIYIFTPKGDVIELPEGSTPVDFAYKIHSHIGDTITDAIVNDQIVPLNYTLKTDDIVRVNTSDKSTPNKDWLEFVKTSQARNHIKAYFNKQTQMGYIERGEESFTKEVKKRNLKLSDILTDENLSILKKEHKIDSVENLYFNIGAHRYTAKYILDFLTEERLSAEEKILNKISTPSTAEFKNHKTDVLVEGCEDILINLANCCKPIYGDDIVGYITKGNGITIHKEDCTNLKDMEERLIDVAWKENKEGEYMARLLLRTNNIDNNVLDIVMKSSQRKLTIDTLNTIKNGDRIDYEIMVVVPDVETLKQFMIDLESLPFVTSVEREVK